MNTILNQVNGLQESINPLHHEANITDGGEFLDDNIRMKDQPLETSTEENQETKFQTKKINDHEFY